MTDFAALALHKQQHVHSSGCNHGPKAPAEHHDHASPSSAKTTSLEARHQAAHHASEQLGHVCGGNCHHGQSSKAASEQKPAAEARPAKETAFLSQRANFFKANPSAESPKQSFATASDKSFSQASTAPQTNITNSAPSAKTGTFLNAKLPFAALGANPGNGGSLSSQASSILKGNLAASSAGASSNPSAVAQKSTSASLASPNLTQGEVLKQAISTTQPSSGLPQGSAPTKPQSQGVKTSIPEGAALFAKNLTGTPSSNPKELVLKDQNLAKATLQANLKGVFKDVPTTGFRVLSDTSGVLAATGALISSGVLGLHRAPLGLYSGLQGAVKNLSNLLFGQYRLLNPELVALKGNEALLQTLSALLTHANQEKIENKKKRKFLRRVEKKDEVLLDEAVEEIGRLHNTLHAG